MPALPKSFTQCMAAVHVPAPAASASSIPTASSPHLLLLAQRPSSCSHTGGRLSCKQQHSSSVSETVKPLLTMAYVALVNHTTVNGVLVLL
jgi:hypothetical protein